VPLGARISTRSVAQMRLRVRNKQDFYAGLMFVGFGLLAFIMARDYPIGSAMRMGPGYFPTYLGGLLISLGAIIGMRAMRIEGPDLKGWSWRPLLVLSGAFIAFGVLMEEIHAGFALALAAVILLASLASREFKPIEAILLVLVLVAGAVGLFIYGLELPYPLFWWS
jgi:hypothetical protein